MNQFHKPTDEKRMMVILAPERYQDWLEAPAEHSMAFMQHLPDIALQAMPCPPWRPAHPCFDEKLHNASGRTFMVADGGLSRQACVHGADLEDRMNVAELIEYLHKFPDDLPVLIEGYETGWDGIHRLRTADMVPYRHCQEWDGEYSLATEFNQAGQPAVLFVGRRGERR